MTNDRTEKKGQKKERKGKENEQEWLLGEASLSGVTDHLSSGVPAL